MYISTCVGLHKKNMYLIPFFKTHPQTSTRDQEGNVLVISNLGRVSKTSQILAKANQCGILEEWRSGSASNNLIFTCGVAVGQGVHIRTEILIFQDDSQVKMSSSSGKVDLWWISMDFQHDNIICCWGFKPLWASESQLQHSRSCRGTAQGWKRGAPCPYTRIATHEETTSPHHPEQGGMFRYIHTYIYINF